jgi:DNA-binding beta-propeller fold protein YncE
VAVRREDGLYPVATVAAGGIPQTPSVDRTTRRVYVPIEDRSEVLVLDTRSLEEIARVSVAANPHRAAANSVTNKVYVIHHEGSTQNVTVVDGRPGSPSENLAAAAISLGNRVVSPLRSVAIDEEANRIYIPSFDPGGRLLVIDGDEDRWMDTVVVSANPISAAFDPLLRRVVLGHGSFFGRTRLSYYDVSSATVSDGPEVGLQNTGLWLDASAHRIYAGHGTPDLGDRFAVTVLNAKTGRTVARIPHSGEPHAVAHPRTGRLYSHSGDDPRVLAHDAARGSPRAFRQVAVASAAPGLKHVTLDAEGDRLFVSQPETRSVLVLEDLNTQTDPRNCGACGRTCSATDVCREGQCLTMGASRLMSTQGAPAGVSHALPQSAAVWTGNRMLVWGGERRLGRSGEGGVYDPATDTWATMSPVGAPSPRSSHTAVWSGREMIVWGGSPRTEEGGRYDPLRDTWRSMSKVAAPAARAEHSAVWTGSKMIVWGGSLTSGSYESTGTGGIYDPQADAWSPMEQSGAPSPRGGHAVVWTGAEMIVWAGQFGGCAAPGGARYDPTTNAWRALSLVGAPRPYKNVRAVWTGRAMFVLGGESCRGTSVIDHAGLYDPSTDTWTLVDASAVGPRSGYGIAWTGSRIAIWGGVIGGVDLRNDGALFDPQSGTFAAFDLGMGSRGSIAAYVWTGLQFIVWGGHDADGQASQTGAVYTPPFVED